MGKPVWFEEQSPLALAGNGEPGMVQHFGIEITEAGDNWLKGRMPVGERTRQPFGLLHGGASVARAETLASVASLGVVDRGRSTVVGLEIDANHLRGVRSGYVTGVVRAIHLGRTIHIWGIRVVEEDEKLVCVSRCTVADIDRTPPRPEAN